MSGWGELPKLNRVVTPECPLYDGDIPLSYLLVLADFYTIILTLSMWIWSAIKSKQLLLLLLSIALVVDWIVNVILQAIIRQPGPFSSGGCGGIYEMPSFATQHITMFCTVFATYICYWRLSMTSWYAFLFVFLQTLVIFARAYIGINTSNQLIIGSAVGILDAIIFMLIYSYWIEPSIPAIMQWKLSQFLELRDDYHHDLQKNYGKSVIFPS